MMDWKESVWRALGAVREHRDQVYAGWYIGDFQVATDYSDEGVVEIDWLDPSDPSVVLEVLLDGLEKISDGYAIEFTPGDEDGLKEYVVGYYAPSGTWGHVHDPDRRTAVIAAIYALAGIEREAIDGD